MASFKVETLIPQVTPYHAWHSACNIADSFLNFISLGCLPISLDSPSGSLGKKVVSLLFHLLASTFHMDFMLSYALVIPPIPLPPKSIDISPKLWIGLYNYRAYISVCISLRRSDVDMSQTSFRLPTLPTHSISVNVMASPSRHPGHLTLPSSPSLLLHTFSQNSFTVRRHFSNLFAPADLHGYCLSSYHILFHLSYFRVSLILG